MHLSQHRTILADEKLSRDTMVTRCNCEQFQIPTVSPNKSLLPIARQQASPNVAPSNNHHEELRVRGDGSPLPCLESAGATGPSSGVVGRMVEGPLPLGLPGAACLPHGSVPRGGRRTGLGTVTWPSSSVWHSQSPGAVGGEADSGPHFKTSAVAMGPPHRGVLFVYAHGRLVKTSHFMWP